MASAVQTDFFLNGPEKCERWMRQFVPQDGQGGCQNGGCAGAIVGAPSRWRDRQSGQNRHRQSVCCPRKSARCPCGPSAVGAGRGRCRAELKIRLPTSPAIGVRRWASSRTMADSAAPALTKLIHDELRHHTFAAAEAGKRHHLHRQPQGFVVIGLQRRCRDWRCGRFRLSLWQAFRQEIVCGPDVSGGFVGMI